MTEKVFECRMCGHCCQGEGGIIVTLRERKRLAEHLDIPLEEFESSSTETKSGKMRLTTGDDGYCLFYEEGKGCSVHPARPDICRAWPFFRGNLIDPLSWEMIQDYCPGVNPKAGFERFAAEGREYLRSRGLLDPEDEDAAGALKLG